MGLHTVNYSRDQISLFIPRRLWHLTEVPFVPFSGKRLHPAYIVDILHTLIFRRLFYNDQSCNMNSEVMRKKYGTHYNFYMRYLVTSGAVTVVGQHCAGRFSRAYRIKSSYVYDCRRWNCRDVKLLKKMNDWALSKEVINMAGAVSAPDYRDVVAADLDNFDIDPIEVSDILSGLGISRDSDSMSVRFEKIMSVSDSIVDRHLFHVKDKYGRLHTNLTILKKQLRHRALRCNGEPCGELDVSNSQPLFLTNLMEATDPNLTNLRPFVSLVRQGGLYEDFSARTDMDREVVKGLVYKVLFGRNMDDACNGIFQAAYPDVWWWIVEWKKIHGGHSRMAHVLQRMESDWVFGVLVKRIKTEAPGVPISTVHDSIIFPVSSRVKIEKIFREEITTLMGG